MTWVDRFTYSPSYSYWTNWFLNKSLFRSVDSQLMVHINIHWDELNSLIEILNVTMSMTLNKSDWYSFWRKRRITKKENARNLVTKKWNEKQKKNNWLLGIVDRRCNLSEKRCLKIDDVHQMKTTQWSVLFEPVAIVIMNTEIRINWQIE